MSAATRRAAAAAVLPLLVVGVLPTGVDSAFERSTAGWGYSLSSPATGEEIVEWRGETDAAVSFDGSTDAAVAATGSTDAAVSIVGEE